MVEGSAVAEDRLKVEELMGQFNTEQACADALYAAKWPNGFRCARCGHLHAYKITTRRLPLLECRACHYQESLTAGTVMEGSRSSLRKWFHAIVLVSYNPGGVNAVQLGGAIGVTYKTAWLILHKLRHAMSQADTYIKLSGSVRVNAAFYGRPHNPSLQRHPQEQPLLVGASVNNEGQSIYIKIKQVEQNYLLERSVKHAGTRAFMESQVEAGAADVEFVTARFSSRRFQTLLDNVKEASRWINKMFHGIGPKYLQAYLDEYCCRLNYNNQEGSILKRLTHLCASTETVTSRSLIGFVVTT
ncbi:transposase [Paenibacillus radicis (ex Xue et al. 2023)]|uniref:Transposase n=1 Tax=Paenibacillus radicis (ex Xue et al. 2023) TaxID=2972489 RepID=A0ABT1YSJ4_9BACL|nr:transposase [Paenibacillus radicis (ex Xue et al. 2023)]MCR8636159.1 transposase [Paenibacillus radicis (ex Xue et al. 2023)]